MTIEQLLGMFKAYLFHGDEVAQKQLADAFRDQEDQTTGDLLAAQKSLYLVLLADTISEDCNAPIQRVVISGENVEVVLRQRLGVEAEFFDTYEEADWHLHRMAMMDLDEEDEDCGAEPPWEDEDDGTGDWDDNNPYEDYR